MGKKKDYICNCHKVTKKDMKTEIKNGTTQFKVLQKDINIGTKCSSCKKKNMKRFNRYLDKYNSKIEVSPDNA